MINKERIDFFIAAGLEMQREKRTFTSREMAEKLQAAGYYQGKTIAQAQSAIYNMLGKYCRHVNRDLGQCCKVNVKEYRIKADYIK